MSIPAVAVALLLFVSVLPGNAGTGDGGLLERGRLQWATLTSSPQASLRESVRAWRDEAWQNVKAAFSDASDAARAGLSDPSGISGLALASLMLAALAATLFALGLIYLKGMTVLTEARLVLDEKRAQLTKLAPLHKSSPALTLAEIFQLIDLVELEPDAREELRALFAARLKEKA